MDERIDPSKLSEFSFASRKLPEYMSYRMRKCPQCDLVYADEPPGQEELARAYHRAAYDSSEEAEDAAAAYMTVLGSSLASLTSHESALEIGTGTGAFLDALSRSGFSSLIGIEPSPAAIEAAPPHRRPWIREGIFEVGSFPAETFDFVACFMTMEHVAEPKVIAAEAHRILKRGGVFAIVTHDYSAPVNRMLGSRSPIVDVEHLQLFSPRSARYLFESIGFENVTVRAFINRYRLAYWTRLSPIPATLKKLALFFLERSGVGNAKIGINVGNIVTVGWKAA